MMYCPDCGYIWDSGFEEVECPKCGSPNISGCPEDNPSEYR
jgi:rubrerythrin